MDRRASSPSIHRNADSSAPFLATRDQYLTDGNGETRGTANPSVMDKPFWKYMIASGCDGYSARKLFYDWEELYEDSDGPVWCFSRFGFTATELPDGRYVHIGGEHEDFYDPDFCIYNDVVVIAAPQRSNSATSSTPENDIPNRYRNPKLREPVRQPASRESITIYGYPLDVFPPTDFHTSTYVRDQISGKEFIFIIGGLGYIGSASRHRTDVHRLDLSDFSIQRLETSGAKPAGETSRHKARLVDDGDGNEAAIKITTEEGKAFSLLINRLEWISHG